MTERKRKKCQRRNFPPVKITLTTFAEDENGKIMYAVKGVAKIDGEDETDKNIFKSCSIFNSFDTLSNLQSTINNERGIGTVSLAVVYGVSILSSFFLPTLVIKSFGCKKTLITAMLLIGPYILGSFYPSWSVMMTTATLCGLVSGPLWTAKSTYVNQISHRYAEFEGISFEVVNVWFFGVSTAIEQNTEIWGNVISHIVLKESENLNHSSTLSLNCGPEFCDTEAFYIKHNTYLLSEDRRYILVSVFTILVLMAAFCIGFFLDFIDPEEIQGEAKEKLSFQNSFATFYHLMKLDQILLIPLSLYTGMANGFYKGDYTRAYITCFWGVPYVATISICYGVVSALVVFAGAPCIVILGRAGLFLLAALAHLAMFLSLILWNPNSEQSSGFYLVAAAHGIGNGVWMSQLIGLHGVLFKSNETAAFSSFCFLHSLGFVVAFMFSSYICTYIKLCVPIVLLVIGLVCYLVVEVRLAKKALTNYNKKRMQQQRKYRVRHLHPNVN